MTIRKTGMARLWAILVAAALLAVTVSTDSDAGSTASRTTRVKFSRTMALPGAIMPPGSYSFDILNPATSSDVVVLTSVGRKVHFIGITRRVERPRGVPSNQVITVREAPPNAPVPITAWFPVGSSSGYEFIYE